LVLLLLALREIKPISLGQMTRIPQMVPVNGQFTIVGFALARRSKELSAMLMSALLGMSSS